MIKKSAIIVLLALFQLTAYAQQTYQLNIKKSKILWDARKTMGGHFGYLLFNSGTLNYSSTGEPTDGTFSLNMNTLRSTDHTDAADNQKVDKELRTPGFFDVANFPAATMVVKQITTTGNATNYKLLGNLTIKGITNPIEFTATIKKTGDVISAIAELDIDRTKWNIDHATQPKSWNFITAIKEKIIADQIHISLNLLFSK